MDPTFQYAGTTRIPPKQFQLRSRIEHSTKNSVNANRYNRIDTNVPDLTYNFPKLTYAKGRTYDTTFDRKIGYSHTDPKLTKDIYGFDISYNDARTDRAPSYANEIVEQSIDIVTGYKLPSYKIRNIPYQDMAPQNTRYDARNYNQSQPYQAGGPDLAENPYFDRYDPVRDPRNAVRELRSAVYEDKGGDHGYQESQRKLRRSFENRWVPEELIDDDLMDTFLRNETVQPQIKGENKYSVKNIEKGLFDPNTFKSCDILDPITKLVSKKPTVTIKDQIDALLKSQKEKDEQDKKTVEEYFKREVKKEVISNKIRSKTTEFNPLPQIKEDNLESFEPLPEIKEEEIKPVIKEQMVFQSKLPPLNTNDKSTNEITLIPRIKTINKTDDYLSLDSHSTNVIFNTVGTVSNNEMNYFINHTDVFKNELYNLTGIETLSINNADTTILLVIDKEDKTLNDNIPNSEYYKYKIKVQYSSPQIVVSASSIIGLSHGTSTLLQLIRSNNPNEARIGLYSIEDYSDKLYSCISTKDQLHIESVINLCRFYKIRFIQLEIKEITDNLSELNLYAESRGVSIIPNIINEISLEELCDIFPDTPFIFSSLNNITNIELFLNSKMKRLIGLEDSSSNIIQVSSNNQEFPNNKLVILNPTNPNIYSSMKNNFNWKPFSSSFGSCIDTFNNKVDILRYKAPIRNENTYSLNRNSRSFITFSKTLNYLDLKFDTYLSGIRYIEDGISKNLSTMMYSNEDESLQNLSVYDRSLRLTLIQNRSDISIHYTIKKLYEPLEYVDLSNSIIYSNPIEINGFDNNSSCSIYIQAFINSIPFGNMIQRNYICIPFNLSINGVFKNQNISEKKDGNKFYYDNKANIILNSTSYEGVVRYSLNGISFNDFPVNNQLCLENYSTYLTIALYDKNNKQYGSSFEASFLCNNEKYSKISVQPVQNISLQTVYTKSVNISSILSLLPNSSVDTVKITATVVGGGGINASGGIATEVYTDVPVSFGMNIEVGLPSMKSSLSFNKAYLVQNDRDNMKSSQPPYLPTISYNGKGITQGLITNGDPTYSTYGYNYNGIPYGAPGYQGIVIIKIET